MILLTAVQPTPAIVQSELSSRSTGTRRKEIMFVSYSSRYQIIKRWRLQMFEGTYAPPFYNNLYGFKDGAQNDIFDDAATVTVLAGTGDRPTAAKDNSHIDHAPEASLKTTSKTESHVTSLISGLRHRRRYVMSLDPASCSKRGSQSSLAHTVNREEV